MQRQLSLEAWIADASGHYTTGRPVTAEEVIGLARQLLEQRVQRHGAIASPDDTREFLAAHFGHRLSEVFAVLFLDTRHRVIALEDLFHGTIDGASVYPREVVRRALHHNAAAVILAHNHPSGIAEPSRSDEMLTQRLRDALALVDVRVLDHIVVAGSSAVSFAERGLL